MNILYFYLIFILVMTAVTFIIWGIDKSNSLHNRFRIPEMVLLSFISLGGSLGALAGMLIYSHKKNTERKNYFHILTGISLIVQISLIFVILGVCLKRG